MVCLSDLPHPIHPIHSAPARERPAPMPLPIPRTPPAISDRLAMDAIYRRMVADSGNLGPDTLGAVAEILAATGRTAIDARQAAAVIETCLLHDVTSGWPIACVEGGPLIAYIRQRPDGGMLVELYTSDTGSADQLQLLLDGQPVQLYSGGQPSTIPLPASA